MMVAIDFGGRRRTSARLGVVDVFVKVKVVFVFAW